MQAIILAGGRGTRLRPLTYGTPKPMVPIKGRPFLEYLLELLKKYGITNIVICSSYLADKIRTHFKTGEKFGLNIKHSIESSPCGTAGALKNAEYYLDKIFFVINGDTYLDINYGDVYQKFLYGNKKAMLVVYDGKETWERKNDVLVEGDRVILYSKEGIDKRVKQVWAGVLLLRKSVVRDYIPSAKASTLEYDLFPRLIEENQIGAYLIKNRYYDIGTFERLKKFEEFIAGK